jgi:anaerobic magnesium-protoporphyrin IX monomethyl ester cyclase
MSLLLINPPLSFNNKSIWKKVNGCTPPLGLALLCAVVEKNNIECDIHDCAALKNSITDVIALLQKRPYDYIGITSVTVTFNSALALARAIKKQCGDSIIIFGGVHPTIFYRQLINEDCIDLIVRNEGEETLVEIMKGKPYTDIPNLSFKKNGKPVHNAARRNFFDISNRPFLAYHKLPMKKYHAATGAAIRTPNLGMIVSRGCPGRCTFCFNGMFGSDIRFVNTNLVYEEIKYLHKNYGIREINFYDDTFTANHRIVNEFCEMLLSNKFNLAWSCFARTDTVNPQILALMKRAGCHQIMYGIESGSDDVLKSINKKTNSKTNFEAIKLTQKAGIAVRAAFMLGNPGETEKNLKQTIDYAVELGPELAIFNVATPFPGTQMFEWAKKNNYLISNNWNNYDLSTPVMRLPCLHENIVAKYYGFSYKRFYMRPGFVAKRLFSIHNLNEIKNNIKGLWGLLCCVAELSARLRR